MKAWKTVGFVLLGLTACQLPQQEKTAPAVERFMRSKIEKCVKNLFFDYERLASEIENYFVYFDEDSALHRRDLVYDFYASLNYEPYWIDISDTLQKAEYLHVLASAKLHGLNKNTYHFDRLVTNLENLSFFYFETGEINYQLWAESEVLLSDALILLAEHLKFGVFNPLNCHDYHYFIPPIDTVFDPFEVFFVEDLPHFFDNLVTSPHYRALQREFIKRLETPEYLRTNRDVDTLNILRVNLERWRWNPLFVDTGRVVYVNIPAFEMFVFRDDSVLMWSRVCVGMRRPSDYAALRREFLRNPRTTQRPRHNETPIFKDAISYMVLNPRWYVPHSIARGQVLRNIHRDSTYLSRMGYLVFQGNTQIDPNTVDWQSVTPDNLSFRFIQSSGAQNAMGRMKFMFPNRFSVYLHDTPSKREFSRRNRAVSHGCVRVENYLEFALVLLEDMPRYNRDYLRKAVGLDRSVAQDQLRTTSLFFRPPIPIIIDYKTAWIDADGNLQIYTDVYERDRLILAVL